jgi:hypothetical protein
MEFVDSLVTDNIDDYNSFEEIILHNLSPSEIIAIKTELIKCQCCLRHQTNRDGLIRKTIYNLPNVCECRCRHYYRFLCNALQIKTSPKTN